MVSIRGLSASEIDRVMDNVNAVFGGNIVFNRYDYCPINHFKITLKVKDSNGTGARRGFNGRKMINACWHVYGLFFDECFRINPAAKIKQCGEWVTPSNNWTDKNIGSIGSPLMHSDACECRGNDALMHNLFVSTNGV